MSEQFGGDKAEVIVRRLDDGSYLFAVINGFFQAAVAIPAAAARDIAEKILAAVLIDGD